MSKRLDLTGKKFGRLTVLGLDEEKTKLKGKSYWNCKCDCGKTISTLGHDLVRGHTKSCGCYLRDVTKNIADKYNKTHGMCNTRLFSVWDGIKQRCNNTNYYRYEDYGGRGITICKEWDDFTNFYNWAMANGYRDDLTIDRVDNNGNYCPENCRWVDYIKQANNRRNNIYITINGDTKTLTEWYRYYKPNICKESFRLRYHNEGFQSVEQLFRDKAS